VFWNGALIPTVRIVSPDTALEFISPVGEGPTVNVTLIVGGQSASVSSNAPAVTLAYTPPTVSRLSIRRELNQATMECFRTTPDGRPVSGAVKSALLVIDGANFGPGGNTTVTVRGTPCVPTSLSHGQIVCIVTVCSGTHQAGNAA
jgi:hypothetical protein